MKRVLIYVAVVCFAALTATGQETTATQEIRVPIHKIKIDGITNVRIVNGNTNSVEVTPSNLEGICIVKDDELTIKGNINDSASIVISSKDDISSLQVAEKSHVVVSKNLNSSAFNLLVGDSAKVLLSSVVVDTAIITTEPYSNLAILSINSDNTEFTIGDSSTMIITESLGKNKANYKNKPQGANLIIADKSLKMTEVTMITQDSIGKITNVEHLEGPFSMYDLVTAGSLDELKKRIDNSSDNKVGYARSINGGIGGGFSSAANNPKSFADILNNGNTALEIKSGGTFYWDYLFPFKLNKWISFHTGLGLEFNWFNFANEITMHTNDKDNYLDVLAGSNPTIPTLTNYSNYEADLYTAYITLPIIFDWRPVKKFGINMGIIGGLKFVSRFTTQYEVNDVEINNYFKEYSNVNVLKADFHFGVSFSIFNVYFRYALVPLFKSGTEERVMPFSIGVALGL
ncbi:MAG: hypothetical protein LBL74_02855 [Bacteroidales bacterium]|jgi:hypothetical protein|nr:hypothetical protein [Bacteroidales bacterium]